MEFMVKEFSTVIVHSRHQLRVPKLRVLRITGWECTIISVIVMQKPCTLQRVTVSVCKLRGAVIIGVFPVRIRQAKKPNL